MLIAYRHVQPHTPRWVRGRQFVSRVVLYCHIKRQLSAFSRNVCHHDACGLCMQKIFGPVGGGNQFLRQCGYRQFSVMLVEHVFDQEVAADEDVAMHTISLRPEDRRDSHCLIDHRHVAVLATLPVGIIAMLPFLKRHLLGEMADVLAIRPSRRCIQGVATAAES